jgi:hypothetical protein
MNHIFRRTCSGTSFSNSGSDRSRKSCLLTFNEPVSLSRRFMEANVLWCMKSPIRKTFLIQPLSHPAISVCCTVRKENICHFVPSMRSHYFAEVNHSLMQTNSQMRRGGACQASKRRIEESRSAV